MKSFFAKSALLIACAGIIAGGYVQAFGNTQRQQCLADCDEEYDICLVQTGGAAFCDLSYNMCRQGCFLLVP
ncbi:MAG: hypothetical protein QNK37_15205 [Acidobacteriota bacterium]|nr:hypothetical protein [Acidobacteriota bacterium]